MSKDEYDDILKCVKQRGTKKQRRAVKSMMETNGYFQAIINKNLFFLLKEYREKTGQFPGNDYWSKRFEEAFNFENKR